MTRGTCRISLQSPTGFWARLWDRLIGRRPLVPTAQAHDKVDFSLVSRVASEHVRRFVESIEDYQLLSRRAVRVVSAFQMPDNPGLQETIPVWLSERIRFGVVRRRGRDFHYAPIQSIEVDWDDEGTDLVLVLGERIAPGTKAFIAAYLGEGEEIEALRDLPLTAAPFHGQEDA